MSPVRISFRAPSIRPSNLQIRFLSAMALGCAVLLGLSASAGAQATCTGLCTQQVACSGGGTTSISGTVYAPNGTDVLPNVLVYIPNTTVQPFTAGVQCNPNGTPASGSPLVSTTTAFNGTFTLTNVPVGSNIPLVIQAGKWRRQFVIPTVSSCVNTLASTAIGTGTDTTPVANVIHLPQNQSEGDIPKIAIATGNLDAVECVLSKMGVATSEFTNPGGSGRINFYLGFDKPGAQIAGGGTPNETQLENNLSTLEQYDLVMLPCQGLPYAPTPSYLANMAQYANDGGRIYATHYSYDFLTYPSSIDPGAPTTSPFQGVASWDVDQAAPANQTGYINTGFPDGLLLAQWLQFEGASTTLGEIPVNTIKHDQDGINASDSQAYLTIGHPSPTETIQFTFSTPVGVPPATQCGRVLYNEYHVETGAFGGTNFPNECTAGALTAQEKFLEYSLFDLGTFSTPPAAPTVAVSFTNPAATLVQGDTADTATINISNTGSTATNTTLSLALTLPSGLTATALTPASPASGWTCNVNTLTCTRGTGLNAGASDNVQVTFAVANTATSPQTLSATVSNGNLANPVTATAQLTVLLLPTIAWGPLAPITYGTPLSQSAVPSSTAQLDAVASYNGVTVPGNYAYTPSAGTVLTPAASPQTLSVAFTPSDPTTYAATTQIVGLQVNPAPVQIQATSPSSITYGTPSIHLSGLLSWPGPVSPTGAVTFAIDNSISVPGTCDSSGSCSATYNSAATLSAGTHTLTVSIAADTNYTAATSCSVQFFVSKATPTVNTSPLTITYGTVPVLISTSVNYSGPAAPTGTVSVSVGGSAPVPASCHPAGAGTLNCTTDITNVFGVPITAGGHTIQSSIVGDTNYTGSAGPTSTLNVIPAPLTVTAGSYIGVYDGSAHALSACVISSNPDGFTCSNNPVGPVGPDVGGAMVLPVVNGPTANYTVTANNGSWSITALPVTVQAGGYSGNYDGSAHPTAACTSSNPAVTCANSPASVGPGVGSGTVTPVASVLTGVASDYTIAPQNSAWSIIPAPSNLNISCPTSVAYNGAAQTPCTATVTGAGGLSQTVTVGYFANTNVGTATATATFANPNYLTSTKMAHFAITPAPLTVTAGSYSGTYDGNAHALSACVVSPNPDNLTCTNGPAGPVGPDVTSGPVAVTPVLSGTASNYSVTSNNGSYAITPALVTAQAGVGNAVYDGNTHSPSACTVTGAYTGNLTCANSPATVGPDVINKSITPVVTGSNLSDFTISPVNGSFTINQATSVTSVTCPASVPYTGAALTPCTATVTGANLNQSVTVIYSSNLHAGTATATATYNGDTDHSGSTKSVNFTITKANPVITWANPAAITYGTPLSSTQLNATANVPGTFFYTAPVVGLNPAGTLLPAGVSPLGAGFTPTDGADYNPISAYVQITVNKATTTTTIAVTTTQTVTGTTATITATVHPQIGGTPTGTVTYYSGSTNLGSAAVGTAFTTGVLPVGTNQITAVYSGDSNFIGSSSSASAVVSVAPTNIILTPALNHVFYPASSVAYTVIVPLKLLQLVSGTITVYDGTTVIGTFNVLPTGVVVGVTPQLSVGTHNLRAVYSGNAQYPPGESPIMTVTVSAL